METLAPASTCRHTRIRVTTVHPTEFIDLTDRLEALVTASSIRHGLINIHTLHTTTAIVINEHEPLLLTDFVTLLERTAPRHVDYRHDDPSIRTVNLTAEERSNGHGHCRALLLGTSAALNVVDGRIQLGTWQRIFLVELDGPRERDVSVMVMGEGGR
jgi:secondary thiamine-phosphate synthase enzyme